MKKCIYLDDMKNCKGKCKYGNFCYKHRNMYLLNDGMISKERFTYKSSDYNVYDIKYTLSRLGNLKSKNCKKEEYFKLLIQIFNNESEKNIVKCQSYIRRYLIQKNNIKGPGYYNRNNCKNTEDFYFMTDINEVDNIYFFSYKDDENNIWYFDIRSFKKLLDHKPENPYTRKIIPQNIIDIALKYIENLKLKNICIDIDTLAHNNRKDITKQRCVDLFSNISQCGYDTNIEWLYKCNIHNLKKLYKGLEDIWNYRAFLDPIIKCRIVSPNGIVYGTSVRTVYEMENKYDIINLIISETNRFENAINESDKRLGYMYFLIGLSEVCHECMISNPWTMYALN
jgi:hypothetical protein